MLISQVLILLKEARMSPEELGAVIGLSGMTVRRWLTKPKRSAVPRLYIPAIREACYTLIAVGRLRPESPTVKGLLAGAPSGAYRAALGCLGLNADFNAQRNMSQDDIAAGLSQIGTQIRKQSEVDHNRSKIFSFKKLGDEWSQRITLLWRIVVSKKISRLDKAVAYGALFYLLTPIDFIPDQIPFFGLLDDFGVLGIAMAFYKKRIDAGII
jgi:uncharacterized membrane protein YkvA (DUF1232 family)